jgi:hypothetical protein
MFELGTEVTLLFSGEFGEVIGRAQYMHGEDNYLVRYMAGDGRQVETWWGASALNVR